MGTRIIGYWPEIVVQLESMALVFNHAFCGLLRLWLTYLAGMLAIFSWYVGRPHKFTSFSRGQAAERGLAKDWL